MIERQTIQGEPAVVAYLNDRMEPVDKDKATLFKVTFEQSGRILFLTARKPTTGPETFVRRNVKIWG